MAAVDSTWWRVPQTGQRGRSLIDHFWPSSTTMTTTTTTSQTSASEAFRRHAACWLQTDFWNSSGHVDQYRRSAVLSSRVSVTTSPSTSCRRVQSEEPKYLRCFPLTTGIYRHHNVIEPNAVVTCEIKLSQNYFSLRRRPSGTFLLSITVSELWGEMCTAWLFSQGTTSWTQILPGQGRPHQSFLGPEN